MRTTIKNMRKPAKCIYLTEKGLKDMKDELLDLKDVKRKQVTVKIQRAREYGDLAENSEYDAAREEQAMIEGRIVELENMLKNVQIITTVEENGLVMIGSRVKVKIDGKTDEFIIVGKVEADPMKKKISNESPVGAALLGAKKGEIVEVTTPTLSYKCKILEIS